MPKITQKKVTIDGKLYLVDILYNEKNDFHAKGLPEHIKTFAFENKISLGGHKTLDNLTKSIDSSIKGYHEAKQKIRKVLSYSIAIGTALLMNQDEECRFQRFNNYQEWVPQSLRDTRSSNLSDKGFTIGWEVLYEIDNGNKILYYKINSDGSIGYSALREDFVIDWTQERENSFKAIDSSLQELVKKIALILGDAKATAQLLDSGLKLLL